MCKHLASFKKSKLGQFSAIVEYSLVCEFRLFSPEQLRRPLCSVCQTSVGPFHYCLHCVHIGCDAHDDHNQSAGHPLSLHSSPMALQCTECGDYVYDSEIRTIIDDMRKRVKDVRNLSRELGSCMADWQHPTSEVMNEELSANSSQLEVPHELVGLRGLVNLGNTCFMNSILQAAFLHNTLVRNCYLSDAHNHSLSHRGTWRGKGAVSDEDAAGSAGGGSGVTLASDAQSLGQLRHPDGGPVASSSRGSCLACELDRLFEEVYSGKSLAPIIPHGFLYALWRYADRLAGYDQQDAHEMIITALNGLHAHSGPWTPTNPSGLTHVQNVGWEDVQLPLVTVGQAPKEDVPHTPVLRRSSKRRRVQSASNAEPEPTPFLHPLLATFVYRQAAVVKSFCALHDDDVVRQRISPMLGNMQKAVGPYIKSDSRLKLDTPPSDPSQSVLPSTAPASSSSSDSHRHDSPLTSEKAKCGNCRCPAHRIFGGTLRSDLACLRCGQSRTAYEPFFDISLGLHADEPVAQLSTQGPATVSSAAPPVGPLRGSATSESEGEDRSSTTGSPPLIELSEDEKEVSPGGTKPSGQGAMPSLTALAASAMHGKKQARHSSAMMRTLYQCLKRFTRTERLGEGHKLSCAHCAAPQEHTKRLSFSSLPPVLVLHFKRFEHTSQHQTTKIDIFVEFPMVLNVEPFLDVQHGTPSSSGSVPSQSPSASEPNGEATSPSITPALAEYNLFGVVVHEGSIGQGHYLSYVRHCSGWYLCDDANISPVEVAEVQRSHGYLLFYMRKQAIFVQ